MCKAIWKLEIFSDPQHKNQRETCSSTEENKIKHDEVHDEEHEDHDEHDDHDEENDEDLDSHTTDKK